MNRVLRNTVVGGAVLGAAVSFAAPAHAAPEPYGALCGMNSVSDSSLPGYQTGTLAGGPVVLYDSVPIVVNRGNLVCTVQTGVDDTHEEADAAVLFGPGGTVVVAAAGTVTYPAPKGDPVFVCTSVNVVGYGTLYYDDLASAWSASPAVSCSLAISANGG